MAIFLTRPTLKKSQPRTMADKKGQRSERIHYDTIYLSQQLRSVIVRPALLQEILLETLAVGTQVHGARLASISNSTCTIIATIV
jgi:hypothetical protein